jgi:putative Holliday junction resolvase
MRNGVRLGIDVGKVRVGIATCDPSGLLATPVETLQRESEGVVAEVAKYATDSSAIEVVVGLPLNLSGNHTPSTEDAIAFAKQIAVAVSVPVRMIDERLTTVSAQSALRSSGKKQRGTRSVIDQVAAVMVLQHALDTERSSGKPAGIAVEDL